jgi:hypothetical protein
VQRRDHRAAHTAARGAVSLHELSQHGFNAPQVCKPGPNVLELEQISDLVEAEPQALSGSDEAHAGKISRAISTYAAMRSLRFVQELLALIEANGLDTDAGASRKGADGDLSIRAVHVG